MKKKNNKTKNARVYLSCENNRRTTICFLENDPMMISWCYRRVGFYARRVRPATKTVSGESRRHRGVGNDPSKGCTYGAEDCNNAARKCPAAATVVVVVVVVSHLAGVACRKLQSLRCVHVVAYGNNNVINDRYMIVFRATRKRVLGDDDVFEIIIII